MKIGFFKLEEWEREYIKKSGLEKSGAELVFIDDILSHEHLPTGQAGLPTARDFDAVSVFVDSIVNAEVLAALPNLKFVTARSTGYDNIDVAACRARGIQVSYVPSYGENTVAEFAFALILALSRKIYDGFDRIRESGSFSLTGLRGFDLKGRTLGVVGTGRIGRHVVRMAQGFEMEVVAYDTHADLKYAAEAGIKYLPLEELLQVSDIVTLHVPHLPETHHLMNAERLALMKPAALLINTARGGVVETEALVAALKNGRLGGAGLDVLEEEGVIRDELDFLAHGHPEEHNLKTILADHILIDLPNVIVTPHNAFNTTEALVRILDTTIENIRGFLVGKGVNLVP
ncbi:MAG: hydroxyacid dehydrogenase [Candidatus Niyogibacteria bacterium]|nr:hydroxyacid dehydrogenase [Candidatus Niyogibacteria bacterium]